MTEREAMQRALQLALHGWGRVAPNPLVGAVLLRDGDVVGEGWHNEFGGAHAEVAALESCDNPNGTTCVVTLEPCAHLGKTPPCVGALIAAGVSRVVASIKDPNSEASGGARKLREHGVEVEFGLEATTAATQNAAFLWNVARPDLPFVTLKVATSLDGFLTDAEGKSQWISGEEARSHVHWLRAGYDALAVGRVTAVEDDPSLTVRGAIQPRVTPSRVIFARTGDVPVSLNVVQTAKRIPTFVVAHPEAIPKLEKTMKDTGVTVVTGGSLTEALMKLRSAGIGSIFVEGGGTLATALLEERLVDRLVWVQAPIWLNQGVRAFGERTAVTLDAAKPWTVTERRILGKDTLLVLDRELCLQG